MDAGEALPIAPAKLFAAAPAHRRALVAVLPGCT
jgi:hypothetical protein